MIMMGSTVGFFSFDVGLGSQVEEMRRERERADHG